MIQVLPKPEIVRWYQYEGDDAPLRVMCLNWPGAEDEQSWVLPDGLVIQGALPRTLGLRIVRQYNGAYSVRLIWDRMALGWESLSRTQLINSCLNPLMAALGMDLWHFLDRPARPAYFTPDYAA